MGIFRALRKGFRFFLMSMGISTYAKSEAKDVVPAPSPLASGKDL